jgi:hypothetical protein
MAGGGFDRCMNGTVPDTPGLSLARPRGQRASSCFPTRGESRFATRVVTASPNIHGVAAFNQ